MDKAKDFEKGFEEYKAKKKQEIEELGQDIYDNCPDLCENGCGGKPCYKCIAEALHRDNYRKIPEDSVVLTGSKLTKLVEEVRQEFEHRYKDKVIIDKEEYNKVDDFFKMSLSAQIAYLRENKRLKEDVQALIGMRFERFNLITQEESDKKVEQSKKETAEKFARLVEFHSVATIGENGI